MSQDQKFAPPSPFPQQDGETAFEFKPVTIPKIDDTKQLVEEALNPQRRTRRIACRQCVRPP